MSLTFQLTLRITLKWVSALGLRHREDEVTMRLVEHLGFCIESVTRRGRDDNEIG